MSGRRSTMNMQSAKITSAVLNTRNYNNVPTSTVLSVGEEPQPSMMPSARTRAFGAQQPQQLSTAQSIMVGARGEKGEKGDKGDRGPQGVNGYALSELTIFNGEPRIRNMTDIVFHKAGDEIRTVEQYNSQFMAIYAQVRLTTTQAGTNYIFGVCNQMSHRYYGEIKAGNTITLNYTNASGTHPVASMNFGNGDIFAILIDGLVCYYFLNGTLVGSNVATNGIYSLCCLMTSIAPDCNSILIENVKFFPTGKTGRIGAKGDRGDRGEKGDNADALVLPKGIIAEMTGADVSKTMGEFDFGGKYMSPFTLFEFPTTEIVANRRYRIKWSASIYTDTNDMSKPTVVKATIKINGEPVKSSQHVIFYSGDKYFQTLSDETIVNMTDVATPIHAFSLDFVSGTNNPNMEKILNTKDYCPIMTVEDIGVIPKK